MIVIYYLQIKWIDGETYAPLDSEQLTDNTSDSVISVLKWEPDEKNVQKDIECIVSNPWLNKTEYLLWEYVFEPRVKINQQNLTYTQDVPNREADNDNCKPVKLMCDWVANPGEVNFTWFVNGVKLKTHTKDVIITQNELLHGKQTVMCEATNEVGTSRHEINLFCKYLLYILYICSVE